MLKKYFLKTFLFSSFLFLINCAHEQKKDQDSPKAYYEKALYYKDKEDYIKALEQLSELRKKFFYSPYNQKAVLLTGDIHFAQEKYSLASHFYEKHLNLYPDIQKDYVLYHIGLSYKKQLPSRVDQDLSHAESALKALNALLNSKEDSSYKKKALKEKEEILDKKAGKELKVALFYESQGWNQAAFYRIEYFLKNYPQNSLRPKALLKAFELAKILDKNPEPFKKKLIDDHPDSEAAKELYENKKKSTFSKWKEKVVMKDTIVFLKSEDIQKLVKGLAKEIDHAYRNEKEPLVLICPLKGSVFFFSDLVRYLQIPVLLDFISIDSSKKGFTILKDISLPLKGRNVLIVKEVLNAGRKLLFLKKRILAADPKSVKIVTLIDKPSRRELDLQPDYFGMTADDRYIFGYGLDHEERHRQLRDMHLFTQ